MKVFSATLLAAIVAMAPLSSVAQNAIDPELEEYLMLMNKIPEDVNGDRLASREEVLAYAMGRFIQRLRERTQKERIMRHLVIHDEHDLTDSTIFYLNKNGDELLTPAEVIECTGRYFDREDLNGDGFLDLDERHRFDTQQAFDREAREVLNLDRFKWGVEHVLEISVGRDWC